MDLTDLPGVPRAQGQSPSGAARRPELDPNELVAQIGREVASSLSGALERVTTLAATGKIDRAGLRALREEIDLARRIGIMGQQVSRYAAGRVQIACERLSLTNLMLEALRQRGREIDARGIELRQVFAPADVSSDPTLLFSLLQAVLDWAFEHAVSRIDLTIDVRNWPERARLTCSFHHRPPDEVTAEDEPLPAEGEPTLDTMSWRLVQQCAAVLGLEVQRKDPPGRTTLTIEFPDTLSQRLPRATAGADRGSVLGGFTLDTGVGGINSQPLAGRHVLVISARREVRNIVRAALRPMGLMLDFVTTLDDATEFCRAAWPHAVVYEGHFAGERFERLRSEALAEVPNIAFVEITEEGKGFQTVHVGGRPMATVARDSIVGGLPAALSHELTRLLGLVG